MVLGEQKEELNDWIIYEVSSSIQSTVKMQFVLLY